MRWLVGLCVAVVMAAQAGTVAAQGAQPAGDPDAVRTFVVVLRDASAAPDPIIEDLRARFGGEVKARYRSALKGYSVRMTARVAAMVAADPRVLSVEGDQIVRAAGGPVVQTLPTGVDRVSIPATAGSVGAEITLNNMDDVRIDADIAILDNGVAYHPDLNVVHRVDCRGGPCVLGAGEGVDLHGTHVAGSAAALDNNFGVIGVAPGARIWSVKVLGDDRLGLLSDVVTGVDYVTSLAGQIDVANMSLECPGCTSTALSMAIANSITAGVTYSVAAGNGTTNASSVIPANHPDVITVSGLNDFDGKSGGLAASGCRVDADDTLMTTSNYGAVVEVTAPAGCITSTSTAGGYAVLSGTSMATAHVSGAAALLASQALYQGDPAAIRQEIIDTGNLDWTDDSPDGVKEPLLEVTGYTPTTVSAAGLPWVSISDVAVTEGATSTTTTATFTVSLSKAPSSGSITVQVATANGTANAPSDYTAVATPVTFTAGQSSKPVNVTVKGDAAFEGNETFLVNLSSPSGATIADGQGDATILDDDPAPVPTGVPRTLWVSDAWVLEGANATTKTANFKVRLSETPEPGQIVKVRVLTIDGTATAGPDYTALPSTLLTFNHGDTVKTVSVTVKGDALPEGNEFFTLRLQNPTNAAIADANGRGTIADEEGRITFSVADVAVIEGGAGSFPTATFTVKASPAPAAGQTVSVDVDTGGGSATPGTDYTAHSSTLTFGAGVSSQAVAVTVNGDITVEPNETFELRLSNPQGGFLADNKGVATIVTDDPALGAGPKPSVTVSDVWKLEGFSGTSTATFTLSLNAAPGAGNSASVTVATADGSATAGSDYLAVGPQVVTFGPLETSKTVDVTVNGDLHRELAETFELRLTAPVDAVIGDNRGLATIAEEEGPMQVSVGNGYADEGGAGTTSHAVFVVRLHEVALSQSVSVTLNTVDGTATSGSDYFPVSGLVVTFAPFEMIKTVPVIVNGDGAIEADETFTLEVVSVDGAVVTDSKGLGTIFNDD